jgi:hypothetical protein
MVAYVPIRWLMRSRLQLAFQCPWNIECLLMRITPIFVNLQIEIVLHIRWWNIDFVDLSVMLLNLAGRNVTFLRSPRRD